MTSLKSRLFRLSGLNSLYSKRSARSISEKERERRAGRRRENPDIFISAAKTGVHTTQHTAERSTAQRRVCAVSRAVNVMSTMRSLELRESGQKIFLLHAQEQVQQERRSNRWIFYFLFV